MKVNLGVRLNPILNGFLNLDCAAQGEKDRVKADPLQLDGLLDHNEIDEVFIVNDTLDYLPLPARKNALLHWLTKIAHNGKVIIMGIDPYEAGRLIYNGQMDIAQANSLIYGIGRKSFVRIEDNVNMVISTGQFVLEDTKYSQIKPFEYVITLRRK